MVSQRTTSTQETEPIPPLDDGFVSLLSESQLKLYHFIYSRLLNASIAEDVLQETNMVICEKSHQFKAGTNFNAWVFKIAHFQIMAQKKRWVRNRISYDDELLDLMLDDELSETHRDDEAQDRIIALEQCLKSLKTEHQKLFQRRYGDEESVQSLAAEAGKKSNAISQTLARIKQNLMSCMEQKLGTGENP